MLKLTTAIVTLAITAAATPSLAQTTPPSPTKALVNIIVAEQFCAMRSPPKEILVAIGSRATIETGLDTPQLVEAGYQAANEIGNAYKANGTLYGFCSYTMGVYAGSGW